MTRPVLLLAAVAMTAVLLARSAAPVAACSCGVPETEEAVRRTFDYYELVVVGAIADTRSEEMQIDVETVYHGQSSGRITLDQPKAPGLVGDVSEVEQLSPACVYTLLGAPGERYLLALNHAAGEGDAYVPGGCSSWSFRALGGEGLHGYLPALERATGGGVAPERPSAAGDDDGLPVVPIVAAALAIPVVFLLGAAFVWRSGRQA